jgi:hypothetical protein
MKLLRDTNIGYSPISARERKIKDGSKYDYLFPKPEMKKTLLKEDGEVEDTIERMRNIVKDYSYQVRNLVKILKGKNRYESVKNVFDFVYNYIKYQVEDGEKLRTPAYTWYEAQVLKRQNPNDDKIGADCDCMSIFCGCCFREMKIPFSFRVTGYSDSLGFCRGFQHVYTIAYDENGKEIICDPVYIEFNKEKKYSIQKTYTMSLNGTDIIMLSGLGDNEYVEQADGGLGELAGRKKRKERRAKRKEKKKARKAARKEKRAAKKEIRKARKAHDKEALAAAKAKKRAAKEKINANRTGFAKAMSKVGKGIMRFTNKAALLLPRAMFCLLLRLNFRGLAKKLANNQTAQDKFAKIWKNLGGGKKAWKKAVEKGKNKKALFGSKKLKGFTELQLQQLGAVLDEWNVLDGATLGDIYTDKELGELGFEPTTTCAAAIASATPIIAKVVSMLKNIGENIPETAEEAEAAGEEVETVDEDTSFDTSEEQADNAEEQEQASDNDSSNEIIDVDYEEINEDNNGSQEEYVEDENMEGFFKNNIIKSTRKSKTGGKFFSKLRNKLKELKGKKLGDPDYQEFYYVEELTGLNGETLGAGLFKKLASGIKNIVQKRKAKKATKKANKEIKKQNKTQKKTARKEKKEQRKLTKNQRKTENNQRKTNNRITKNTRSISQSSTASDTRSGNKVTDYLRTAANSEAGQMIKEYATDAAMQKAGEVMDKFTNKATDEDVMPNTQPTTNGKKESGKNEESWFSQHKGLAIGGGIALLGLIGGGIYLATRNNNDKEKSNDGKLNALSLY